MKALGSESPLPDQIDMAPGSPWPAGLQPNSPGESDSGKRFVLQSSSNRGPIGGTPREERIIELKKRVLVTGGAGFLGSHLCERLLGEGCDVLCVDNYFTGGKENIVEIFDSP